MKRLFISPAAISMGVLLALSGCSKAGPSSVRTRKIDLGPLLIDQLYPSMDGPFQRIRFDYSDMDWVVGFRTDVLDVTTGERMGEEFYCHSQLQLDNGNLLIVNAPGASRISFPEGFGMPLRKILSGVPEPDRGLTLLGMAMNPHEPEINRLAKIRIQIDYLRTADIEDPDSFKKLYQSHLGINVEDQYHPEGHDPHGKHQTIVEGRSSSIKHGGHWLVPPGRQVLKQRHSGIIPVDAATVHLVAVHLHNYGVSMRLTDITEGRVLWHTEVVYEPDRVQISNIPAFLSPTGFPIYKDHEYEVESLYENTTDQPIDAMAIMFLYYHPLGDEDITYPGSYRAKPVR